MDELREIKIRRALGNARTRAEYHGRMFDYHIKKDDGDIGDLFRTIPIAHHLLAYFLCESGAHYLTQKLNQAGC